jgi:hypothetical protein
VGIRSAELRASTAEKRSRDAEEKAADYIRTATSYVAQSEEHASKALRKAEALEQSDNAAKATITDLQKRLTENRRAKDNIKKSLDRRNAKISALEKKIRQQELTIKKLTPAKDKKASAQLPKPSEPAITQSMEKPPAPLSSWSEETDWIDSRSSLLNPALPFEISEEDINHLSDENLPIQEAQTIVSNNPAAFFLPAPRGDDDEHPSQKSLTSGELSQNVDWKKYVN